MRRTTRRVAVGIAGAAIALGCAATAHAEGERGDHDKVHYWTELRNVGLTGTPDDALDLALSICGARATGAPEKALINGLVEDEGFPRAWAVMSVVGAEFHFCPQHADTYNEAREALR